MNLGEIWNMALEYEIPRNMEFHMEYGIWNMKFGLGIRNEAGQRLIEFCQENALVIANTLFQQHKRRLYTWTSPDGQHQNQIDYILCSQRWRSSIQSAKNKTRSWLWLRSWMPCCQIQNDTCAQMFIAALFTIARTWTQPKWMLEFLKRTFFGFQAATYRYFSLSPLTFHRP